MKMPPYCVVGPAREDEEGKLFIECRIRWWGIYYVAWQEGIFWRFVWHSLTHRTIR